MPQDSKELQFWRVIDPNVFNWIPRALYQQIEGMNLNQIANLIRYGKHTLNRMEVKDGKMILIPNELVHIAVLVDQEAKIRGFVWAEIDIVEELIFVQAASVERAYQGNFKKRITDYLFGLNIEPRYRTKIRMATRHPRAFERSGWKKAELVLMEIENNGMERTNPGHSGEPGEPV